MLRIAMDDITESTDADAGLSAAGGWKWTHSKDAWSCGLSGGCDGFGSRTRISDDADTDHT